MTQWKSVKSILKGRNKGSSLLALGVFLVTLGASYQIINSLGIFSLSIAGNLLVLLGLMAFSIGFLKYAFDEN